MRATAILIAACANVCLATSAFAAADAYAPGDGTPNFKALSIPVTASVGGSCGFATANAPETPNDTVSLPDFDVAGFSHDTAFVLKCNGPSRVAIVSSNGALVTTGTPPAGYTNQAPYTVALHMQGDGGSSADGTCAVADLKATSGTPCTFRGPASLTQGLYLSSPANTVSGSYVRISAPTYVGSTLLASNAYQDTLTVTLSAAP